MDSALIEDELHRRAAMLLVTADTVGEGVTFGTFEAAVEKVCHENPVYRDMWGDCPSESVHHAWLLLRRLGLLVAFPPQQNLKHLVTPRYSSRLEVDGTKKLTDSMFVDRLVRACTS